MTKYIFLTISILIGANAGATIGKVLPNSRVSSGQFACSYYEKIGPESYNALIQEVNDNCDSNKHFQINTTKLYSEVGKPEKFGVEYCCIAK